MTLFLTAIKNTWLLWILNFIPQIGIAMLLSVWFTNARLRIRGVGVWRALFYLPNLLMPAAVAALFFSLFSYFGPVNQFLVRSGITDRGEAVLAGSDRCPRPGHLHPVVDVVWRHDHYPDGRDDVDLQFTSMKPRWWMAPSSMQMFRRITLPLLKPILIYIFVTSMVGGMQMFDIPYLLTDGRGSPSQSILTNNILMYLKFSSAQGHIGAASAVGVLVFIMTCLCALGIFYFLRDKDKQVAGRDREN